MQLDDQSYLTLTALAMNTMDHAHPISTPPHVLMLHHWIVALLQQNCNPSPLHCYHYCNNPSPTAWPPKAVLSIIAFSSWPKQWPPSLCSLFYNNIFACWISSIVPEPHSWLPPKSPVRSHRIEMHSCVLSIFSTLKNLSVHPVDPFVNLANELTAPI